MTSIGKHLIDRARAITRTIGIVGAVLVGLATAPSQAGVFNEVDGVGLKGHDPVAYFDQGAALPGNPEITAVHHGVTYRFASSDHQARFVADPDRFLPQYGGFCAFGTAGGYKADIDPQAFSIVDGKLYLNYSKAVQSRWQADVPGFIRKADDRWPEVQATEKVFR